VVSGAEEIIDQMLLVLVVLSLLAFSFYLLADYIARTERDWRDDEPTEHEDRRFRGRR